MTIFRRIGGRVVAIARAGDWAAHTPKNVARTQRLVKKAAKLEKMAIGINSSPSVMMGTLATRKAATRISNQAAKGRLSSNMRWVAKATATGKHPVEGTPMQSAWLKQKTKIAVKQLRAAHSFVLRHTGKK